MVKIYVNVLAGQGGEPQMCVYALVLPFPLLEQ